MVNHMIVSSMVTDLRSSLCRPSATLGEGEREACLFALNAYLFEHELDVRVCFMNRHDGAFGIAVFMGRCDIDDAHARYDEAQLINMQLMRLCDMVAIASPVEHNTRRIDVRKNRWGPPGLYEDRDAVSAAIMQCTGLRVTFTMRLP